jgi:hypothetical protein
VREKKQNSTQSSKMPSEDYFKSLEEKILAKTAGKEYHLPLGLVHPFIAPDGYFETLEARVLTQASKQSFQLIGGIKHPFKAPKGYFIRLDAEVLSKTTILNFVLEENILHPFLAPKGYLEAIDKGIYAKTINQKSTSALQIVWRNYGQFIRIAATLLVVGLFGLGIYSNFYNSASEELSLAELRTDAIYTYLDEQNLKLDDFEVISDEFSVDSFSDINETEMDIYTDEELLELVNFQYSNDI